MKMEDRRYGGGDKMKICLISSYPPRKCGIGFLTEKFVNEVKKRDFKIFTLTFKNDYSPKDSQNNILRIFSKNPLTLIKSFILLRKIMPDIIHVHYAISMYGFYSIPMFFMLGIFRKISKSKFIIEFHEVTRDIKVLSFIAITYYAIISRIFDGIYVHTKVAKDILVNKCFITKKKIKIIQLIPYKFDNIDNSSFPDICKIFNFGNRKIVLYFGFIHPDKGIEYLLEAAKLIKDRYISFENLLIVIAGDVRPRYGFFKIFEMSDRKYSQKLYKLRKSLRLEDFVRFTGYIDQEHVYPLLHASRVIVLPYLNLEQSSVLNLAMAIPRPVIASNVGGLEEMLKNFGILVPPRNPERIASEIMKLLQDDSYYDSVIKRYEKIQEEHDVVRIVNMVIEDYEELLED